MNHHESIHFRYHYDFESPSAFIPPDNQQSRWLSRWSLGENHSVWFCNNREDPCLSNPMPSCRLSEFKCTSCIIV